ncbi:MAG: SDR family oxidoreductase [Byssovorax sp.]
MKGRVCVVTGASSGIGKVTARALAARGATVILVVRDEARGAQAAREIRRATGSRRVSVRLGDLSSQRSVSALAAALLAELPALHVLVNNAGAVFAERALGEDGLELTFATNHLGPYLLTRLLLPRLCASTPSRIVNVASEMHRFGTLCWSDLQHRRGYAPLRAYNAAKLANVAFTFELSRRLRGTGVTANAVHPGVIESRLGGHGTAAFQDFMHLVGPLLLDEEEGALPLVQLAAEPSLATVSGKYFRRMRPARASAEARDPAVGRRLWEVSERLTGLG